MNLDPEAKFLCEKDIHSISNYALELDNALVENNAEFIVKVSSLFYDRLIDYRRRADSLLTTSLNFSEKEYLPYKHKTSFESSPLDLVILQKKHYKLMLLEALLQQPNIITNSVDFLNFEKSFRAKILDNEHKQVDKIKNYTGGIDKYVCKVFLQSIASASDPHTAYLTSQEYSNFQISLSSEGLSFGFSLEDDRSGGIRIDNIVPNGPAWNSSRVVSGDILTGYSVGNDFIDISFFDSDEVLQLLHSSSINEVTLHLLDLNKKQKSVSLIKGQIELSENMLKGLTLVGDKRIGYISLPGFYTQWKSTGGESSANDLAKEILKLKKEKIDGLILDLRFNGGGSMQEAFDLIGLFIDMGPLAIIKNQQGTLLVAKDMSRGTVYDGPLAILVNRLSASASEIVAATLQDYNRAVILGSPTYGKATAQVLMPLRSDFAGIETNSSMDFQGEMLKVTTEKIYRITGLSYQKQGVNPDVVLSDLTESIVNIERNYSTSIQADSVNKKTYYNPFPLLPKNELAKLSYDRFMESSRKITNVSSLITAPLPLVKEEFVKHSEKFRNDLNNLKRKTPSLFAIQPVAFDNRLNALDDYSKAVNQKLIEELSESLYIEEAYHILVDLINFKK